MNRLSKRPNVKLAFRKKDKLFEIFGLLFLLSYWLVILATYYTLPDSIPTHYNAIGGVDNYGEKSKLLNLPVWATILYLIITAFSSVPQYFNYLEKITYENAEKEYRKAVNTFRFLKILVVACYLTISIYSTQLTQHANYNLIIAALPYILLMPTFYYLSKK
ncbi:DUF1648 domain-containing protein [Olivibacter sp. SDN3]|uniref:DUF1648 domain-containing protein n=1 Tax=Olivibacter sp. SDN3 TaxID=2764720 RepID=UPI0016513DB1|nr:DUF1648 domain-containing protein [Olivibacter sp. SDN3]QNL48094.1 DUF1648 domain-containing protein [Olivibacter sp. SDN3]